MGQDEGAQRGHGEPVRDEGGGHQDQHAQHQTTDQQDQALLLHALRNNEQGNKTIFPSSGEHRQYYCYQDTNQVDSNFERINFWSTIHLIMMIVVGVTQVKRAH